MTANPPPNVPTPRRGEIWTANLGAPPMRHWVVVISVDARNLSRHAETVLVVPFGSRGLPGPTTLCLQPGETGLPGPSWLKAHFVTTLGKTQLRERLPRPLSTRRMREVVDMVRRAIDPDAPYEVLPHSSH